MDEPSFRCFECLLPLEDLSLIHLFNVTQDQPVGAGWLIKLKSELLLWVLCLLKRERVVINTPLFFMTSVWFPPGCRSLCQSCSIHPFFSLKKKKKNHSFVLFKDFCLKLKNVSSGVSGCRGEAGHPSVVGCRRHGSFKDPRQAEHSDVRLPVLQLLQRMHSK